MWVGVCSGIGLEGWLRWFTHPFGGIVCRGHVQYPAFPPDSLEVAIGFWSLLGMHACFCPVQSLCVLVLKEMFVKVPALQQWVPSILQYLDIWLFPVRASFE